jgi:hypothetical protein
MAVEKTMECLENHVDIKNPEQIKYYLSLYRDLIDLIPIAVGIAKKYFPESRIVLDVYIDPEINDSYLVLYLRLSQYDESFIDKLSIAESELLPLLADKEGWIQMSTDFECIDNNK